MDDLKVSVIIVCYNSVTTIEQAICSVVNQTYKDIELIVIDGKSSDGTVEILKKYDLSINFWASEHDEGIYDAMNKGIMSATGEYIYFLGSDDCLVDFNSIERVMLYLEKNINVDILCGRVWGVDEGLSGLQTVLGKPLIECEVLSGEMSPHQGMLVRSALMKQLQFDVQYKIAADYDFFLRAFLMGRKIAYIDEFIAFYNLNGHSSQVFLCFDEYKKILENHQIKKVYIDHFVAKKINKQWIKRRLKRLVSAMHIGRLVQALRGYETHSCNMAHCRWCGRT